MAERFRVVSFATVISQLREAVTAAMLRSRDPDAPSPTQLVMAAIKEADLQFQELSLSEVLRNQWKRLLRRSELGDLDELIILIREMNNNLMVELSSAWFLIIPADRRFLYQQPQPIFGQAAHDAFPGARRDIAASGRCYAIDEWTACVFHAMRALEHPLLWLGNRVSLAADELKWKNWKNIIDQIEKKIRAMENDPKTEEKAKRVQFLSEAATQFRWFKDAWRNSVAHSHVHYDEREGSPIFLHVSEFFRHIASEAIKDGGV